MTLLRPRPDATEDVQALLEDLDASLAGSEGLLLSLVTRIEANRLGRIAIWQSKDEANHEATLEHVLSLRSRLRFLSVDTQEVLMEVKSGHAGRDVASLLARAFETGSLSDLRGPAVA